MEHYCNEHRTKFFKKGAMKGYAHPIGDTGKWCNEPEGASTGQTETKEKPFTYSPEKSASIETQVAVKATTDLIIADKLSLDSEEGKLLRDWLLTHLMVNPKYLEVNPTATKDTVVYADKTQKEMLKKFYENIPVKFEEIMKELGFDKKLTHSQADVLIAKLIIEQEAKN